MSKIQLSEESISKALALATSMTAVWHSLGGKGSIPGSTAKKLRDLCPDIMQRLAANKGNAAPKAKDQKPKPRIVPKSGKFACRRHAKNPFREGSAYGLLVDLMAQAGDKGIARDDLLKDFCRITKKPLKNAVYNLQVILSAATEKLHKSCAQGFQIVRQGQHYTIKFK